MKKFQLLSSFRGYSAKGDLTNIDPRLMVAPSQNVIINDGEKVSIRDGYTLYGVANATLYPIVSSYDWKMSNGTERNLRKYNTNLEYYYSAAWRTLSTGFGATVNLNFAEWWSSAEAKDHLIFVDGTSNLYMWSGAVTTYASSTVNTITKEGTNTWAVDRFLVAGTRQVTIGSVIYTYTGGESTTTLTGVTPDPTAGGHSAGDVVVQTIRTTATTPAAAVLNGIIGVVKNQIYVADLARRDVYVSKNTDYTSFTFTTPTRVPGEGGLLTLDGNPNGFAVQEEAMYISTSNNDWYQTKFTLSADLTKEELKVEKLKTGPLQGAVSQSSIGTIKNSVVFFSNERTLDTLGRLQNINTPQSFPLSDPIKTEIAGYDITIAPDIKYWRNNIYITFPSEGKVLIYDLQRQFWQPPQILPVRKFAIIGGLLYGHSNSVPETYKLFDGTSDNTNPISAKAYFAYRTYGRRDWKKNCNEWFSEGYIASNTTLRVGLKYDFGGFTSIVENDIHGTDVANIFSTTTDNSFGKNPLGSQPLGSITDSIDDLSKFRVIHDLTKAEFYEIQCFFETNDIDYQWELLATGGNVALSNLDNNPIKT